MERKKAIEIFNNDEPSKILPPIRNILNIKINILNKIGKKKPKKYSNSKAQLLFREKNLSEQKAYNRFV
jgi:hypothetical protein